MGTLKRLLPSITGFHDDETSLTSLEARLICNAFIEPTEMLRLVAVQTVKTESEALFLKSLLKITNCSKSFAETFHNSNRRNIIDFILSLEYYIKLSMRELWRVKSCSIFIELINNLKKCLINKQDSKDVRNTVYETDKLKHKLEKSRELYFRLTFFSKMLESTSKKTLFNQHLQFISTHNQYESKVRNASDLAFQKEKDYENEILHYYRLLKQEKEFKVYLQACVNKISFYENELEFWSTKYESEMEALENKRHSTQITITNVDAGIAYYKDAINESHKQQQKEKEARKERRWENVVVAAKKIAAEEQAINKNNTENLKKPKTKKKIKSKKKTPLK